MTDIKTRENYHIHITAGSNPMLLNLKDVWNYRDLIMLLTQRNFKLIYKQTVLGPLWVILTPLITSIIYTIVFGGIIGLSTAGVPKILFYLCSHSLWSFFSGCLNRNMRTFLDNTNVFSKVYFPRLTIPVSVALSTIVEFLIQFAMTFILLIYFFIIGEVSPNWAMLPLVIPVIFVTGVTGLSLGVFISSVTIKYRDLSFLVGFGLQLWMYASPVIYPVSQLQGGFLRTLLLINPITAPMELFRLSVLGVGTVSAVSVISSLVFLVIASWIGIYAFNKAEKNFIDII